VSRGAHRDRRGICRICGTEGKLSFEHVPPEAAFNDRPLVMAGMRDLIGRNPDQPRGRTQQRGAGDYTLCEPCNSRTGHWYGSAYVEWARQALMIVGAARGCATLYYGYRIHPLRVLKQVICMFFSANGVAFARRQPDLVRFVLGPEQRGLHPDIQVFAFLTTGGRARQCGVSALGRFDRGDAVILSEVTFPPFGFVLCLGSPAPDARLIDITFFAKCGYHEARDVFLRLPVLPVYSHYPGDYRSREAVLEQVSRSLAAGSGMRPISR
jgi:hypothetical protein